MRRQKYFIIRKTSQIGLKRSFRNTYSYLKCGAKTVTFLFWVSLYVMVMKMTVFKGNADIPERDMSMIPDNYSLWLLQGPVLGDDDPNEIKKDISFWEPDNETITEIEDRVATVRRVCQDRSLISQPTNNKEFFVDHKHNLVWCNIFKAGSSYWMYNFNLLGGYEKKYLEKTRYNAINLARRIFKRPSIEELKDAVSTPGVITFLIVRDPFVRLLSAYRDKLENQRVLYYRKLQLSIVTKYRTTSKIPEIVGPNKHLGPTFLEFSKYLIDAHKAGEPFDEHWAPYYDFCTPCSINFTVIAKVETLARDSAYIIYQLGLGQLLGKTIENRKTRIRTVMNKSRDGRNTNALIKHYYSQLDAETLNGLLNIYGTDFEMFGYNSDIYKSYVRNVT